MMMFQVLGVCGFYKSGCSAVCDLLQEFNETQMCDNFEFSIIRSQDGIMDLDEAVNRYHIQQKSITAINRFRVLINKSPVGKALARVTNSKIYSLTDEYLNSLVQIKWKGKYSFFEAQYKSGIWRQSREFCRFLIKQLKKLGVNTSWFIKQFEHIYYRNNEISIYPIDFINNTKKYLNSILHSMDFKPDKVAVLDQAFIPCDPISCLKYFDSPRAIIVTRDPRDQYLYTLKIYRYSNKPVNIPIDSVNNFINYYKLMHQNLQNLKNRDDILIINYESLVYDYEHTVNIIMDFASIRNHANKGNKFNKERAKHYTRLAEQYPEYSNDIMLIEQQLSEYLYPFEDYSLL